MQNKNNKPQYLTTEAFDNFVGLFLKESFKLKALRHEGNTVSWYLPKMWFKWCGVRFEQGKKKGKNENLSSLVKSKDQQGSFLGSPQPCPKAHSFCWTKRPWRRLTMTNTLWVCSYKTKLATRPGMSSANVFYTYILNHFVNIFSSYYLFKNKFKIIKLYSGKIILN